MADEQLRLVATLVNTTGPVLKDLQRSMRALAADTKLGHQMGVTQAKDHALALTNLRRTVVEAGTATREILAPALATLGISGLSAAGGLAAVVAAVKGFSDSARSLTFLARESGLAINTLRAFQDLAPKIGASSESMSQSLASFGDHMTRLGRTGQGFILEMRRINQAAIGLEIDPRTTGIDALAISLQKLPREQQLQKVLDFALRFKDIDVRKKILQIFDAPKEFANVTSRKELNDLIEQQKKVTKPLTAGDIAGGKRTADDIDDLTTRLRNLRDALATSLIPQLEAFTKQMQILGDSELGKGLRGFAGGIDAAVSATTGWLPVLELYAGYRALKFFRLAAGLRSVGAGLGEIAAVPAPPSWIMPLLGAMAAAGAGKLSGDEIAKKLKEGAGVDVNAGDARPRKSSPELDAIRKEQDDYIAAHRGMPPVGGEGLGIIGGGPRAASPRSGVDWLRNLFRGKTSELGTGIMPAAFRTTDGGPNPLLGSPSTSEAGRLLSTAVEKGVYDGLVDYARSMKGEGGGGAGAGGGGGGGGGMAALRASYQPGGGGGYGGAGAGTGEPSAGGGAGTGQRPSANPMGTGDGRGPGKPPGQNEGPTGQPSRGDPRGLSDFIRSNAKKYGLSGDAMVKAWGSEGLRDSFGASARRENSWGATQLHYPGLANEFEKDTGLKANDPKNERAMIDWSHAYIAKHPNAFDRGRGGKWFGPGNRYGAQAAHAMAQHVAPSIRESLQGPAGDGGYRGVGGYNFMGSARAAAMGMGDVRAGGPLAHMNFPTGIPKGEGPTSITANKYAGTDMAGFLKDLHDAGAPLKNFSGVYANRSKRGGGGPSQHAFGNAMDIETGFGSGPNNSPALYAWAQAHPKEFAEIQAKHHMRNLDTSSGARMHDWGHFEWTPEGRQTVQEAAKATKGIAEAHALHGEELKKHFGVGQRQKHADLLGHARDAGLVGAPMQHRVTGSASLDVNLNGFPKGTTHRMKADGLFKETRVNRGVSMPRASESA